MRHALAVEYAGNAFCGFQSQPTGCGVQDALERAIAEIAGHPVTVIAAGRTDAGVHAMSQIVHFESDVVRPQSAWVRGVNAHLPRTAAVLWAREVADEFHARFAATARHYTYLLLTRPERPALLDGRVGWYHQPLDCALIEAGTGHLRGTHDFSAFRAAECQAKSPVKTLTRIVVTAQSSLIRFDFSANAFLHHMIRNIVGALVYVGAEKHDPAWIAELLAGRDRTRAAPTFASDGLYLCGAEYPPHFDLPPTVRRVELPAP
jgi:tRNA pseudouridine38-40 synthase